MREHGAIWKRLPDAKLVLVCSWFEDEPRTNVSFVEEVRGRRQ